MASVYKRGNIWWVRFIHHGKEIRQSSLSQRKAEATALLKRLKMAKATKSATGQEPFTRTYDEATDRYFKEANLKPRTRETYQSNNRALIPTMTGKVLPEINRGLIAEHITRRKEAEIARYLADISEWEQREYFDVF